jgi:hypothetical protein
VDAGLVAKYRAVRTTVGEMIRASLGEQAEEAGADPRVVASFLIAVFDGFVLQWLLDPDDTPSGHELIASLGTALSSALGTGAGMQQARLPDR